MKIIISFSYQDNSFTNSFDRLKNTAIIFAWVKKKKRTFCREDNCSSIVIGDDPHNRGIMTLRNLAFMKESSVGRGFTTRDRMNRKCCFLFFYGHHHLISILFYAVVNDKTLVRRETLERRSPTTNEFDLIAWQA